MGRESDTSGAALQTHIGAPWGLIEGQSGGTPSTNKSAKSRQSTEEGYSAVSTTMSTVSLPAIILVQFSALFPSSSPVPGLSSALVPAALRDPLASSSVTCAPPSEAAALETVETRNESFCCELHCKKTRGSISPPPDSDDCGAHWLRYQLLLLPLCA